jgi:hypothetical protein
MVGIGGETDKTREPGPYWPDTWGKISQEPQSVCRKVGGRMVEMRLICGEWGMFRRGDIPAMHI